MVAGTERFWPQFDKKKAIAMDGMDWNLSEKLYPKIAKVMQQAIDEGFHQGFMTSKAVFLGKPGMIEM